MVVVFALGSALAYGLSDFFGGLFSKRIEPWVIAFVGQASGAAFLAGLTPLFGGEPRAVDLAWGMAAGFGGGLGSAFMYRGLARGRMGVVAPVSAIGAAVLPVAVGLGLGERPALLVWCGILVAAPAIWLVASDPPDIAPRTSGMRSGLADGVLAGLSFGTLFVALGQVPESAGLAPVALSQVSGAIVVAIGATIARTQWLPRSVDASLGVIVGVLAAVAVVLFTVAAQTGLLSVAAVLSSLYPASTVLLAATVLREHIHRSQAAGLLLCAVAIAFVAGG